MSEKINVAEIFGTNVFNDAVMRERLPKRCMPRSDGPSRAERRCLRLRPTWWPMP